MRMTFMIVLLLAIDIPLVLRSKFCLQNLSLSDGPENLNRIQLKSGIQEARHNFSSGNHINNISSFCGFISLFTILIYIGYVWRRYGKKVDCFKKDYLFQKIDATYYEIYPLKYGTSAYKTYIGDREYSNVYSYTYYDQPYVYVENQPENLPFVVRFNFMKVKLS
ncbi:putative orfan [Tupanvirus soda lake]|uniref:Orfan n=2 Tax=Tupanvirus TaxID=2094720 RepID=A0AC62ADH3_9VIRU|nr:putative orfan [Tupanvirus soda lake]QKU35733.1 putative orfan [Tupanvirus soda lake]